MERRLAAILVADIVSYSRLMEADETGTIARQKRHRAELIDPRIAAHHGRIVKLTGDGMIAEFPSVVEAVQCAVTIQREMKDRELDQPEERRIRYRVAVNLGDVIFDEGDVYGDGVNIAARLEALAEPGGVVVSGTAYDHLKTNVDVDYEDLGEQQVKNIATPVRVYRVVPEGSERAVLPRRRSRGALLAASFVVVALLIAGAFLWSSTWLAPDAGTGRDPRRVVVLPFANISADPGDAYFSDGLTEELISRLSRIGDLGVIARTSAMQYRDTDKGIDQIGRELSVGTVLEGSVRKSGDRVRITVQLIDVTSQEHLWSADYDRDLQDVFAIQTEISEAVIEALKLTLVADTADRPMATGTQNMEVYTLYLKGRYLFLNERTKEGYEKAIQYYEQALAIDPDYAPAYAGLAEVHNQATWVMSLPASETYPKAKEMAEQALALDPNLADAWSALAAVEIDYYWDWEAGERAVKRALEIDPNHVLTLSLYAHRLLSAVYGRYDEAVETMERAVALDPLSLQAHNRFGLVLWHAGQLDRAIEQCRETIATWPNYVWPRFALSRAYSAKGMHDEAIEQMLIAVDLSKRSSYFLGYLATTYAGAGRREDALALVEELEQRAKTSLVSASAFAAAYAAVGDADRLIDALEQLYEERHPDMLFLRIHDQIDPFRSDPRVIALTKRMGLSSD
jgi:class 3 adenylate cyclase/TolB-like protein